MLGFKHSTFTKPRCNTKMELFHLHCSFFLPRSCIGAHFSFALGQSSGPHLLSSGITAVNFHTWFMIFFFSPSPLHNSVSKQHLKYLVTKHLKGEYQRLGTQKLHSGVCRVSGRVPTAYFIPRGNSVHTVSILERMSTSHANMVFVEPPGKGVSMGL